MRIAGVILAGGLASRMGGSDKTLRLLRGVPLLHHVVQRLRPQVEHLALNANGDPSRFAAFGLPVIADTVAGRPGPLAGILAGMQWAIGSQRGVTHLLTVPGDAPYLPPKLAERLAETAEGRENVIVVARAGGQVHPVFGLWPLELVDALESRLASPASRSVAAFASAYGAVSADFPIIMTPDGPLDPFFNVNTPADLQAAETLSKWIAA